MTNPNERTFLLIWYLGERVIHQSIHQWPLCIPTDSLHSMSYAKMLSLVDMTEMKVGHHCVDFIDHKCDYRVYL